MNKRLTASKVMNTKVLIAARDKNREMKNFIRIFDFRSSGTIAIEEAAIYCMKEIKTSKYIQNTKAR